VRSVVDTPRRHVDSRLTHVWLVEPDGTSRAGIRGCESWGWVDSTRLFCEGTINPNYGVYLVFDARTGRELQELIGTGFVWSPDRSRIADVEDARELGTVSDNSNSIEVQGKPVFPSEKDSDLHWFRSGLVWSPGSRYIAVVDLRRNQGSLFLVVVGVTGSTFEHKLDWQENGGDWPPELDFSVRWVGAEIIVTHGGRTQTVKMAIQKGNRTKNRFPSRISRFAALCSEWQVSAGVLHGASSIRT